MSQDLKEIRQELQELQSQVAFQEDTVHSLHEALAAQQQEIMLMRRQLELLKARQDEQSTGQREGNADALLDEKPPHY